MQEQFIGRSKEIRELRELIERGVPSICVIYGRRRIGKSELIKHVYQDCKVLIFEGLENKPKKEQIEHFIFQLNYQLKIGPEKTCTSWKSAFLLLYEAIKNNPYHIVFDEFQWMANYKSDIVSELKFVWEQHFSKLKGVTLVLCGSIASYMIDRVIKSSALYGRTELQIHVKAFTINETGQMLPGKSVREIIEAHLFTGGIPKYLSLLRDKPSIRIGIEELAFKTSGYLFAEYERIFLSHFGKNKDYEKIITLLAHHPYGLFRYEIAQKVNFTLGGVLSKHLKNLKAAGFISIETPFDKPSHSRLIKYFLSDAYLRFYFIFIFPNIKKITTGVPKDIFSKITQTGAFYAWMGKSFEYFCIQHAHIIAQKLGFSGIDFSCGPYFKPRKLDTKGIQIDLLFDRADHVLTLCEMKYTNKPIGMGIVGEVERRCEILQKNFPQKTIQKILITESQSTKELQSSGYFYKILTTSDFLDND